MKTNLVLPSAYNKGENNPHESPFSSSAYVTTRTQRGEKKRNKMQMYQTVVQAVTRLRATQTKTKNDTSKQNQRNPICQLHCMVRSNSSSSHRTSRTSLVSSRSSITSNRVGVARHRVSIENHRNSIASNASSIAGTSRGIGSNRGKGKRFSIFDGSRASENWGEFCLPGESDDDAYDRYDYTDATTIQKLKGSITQPTAETAVQEMHDALIGKQLISRSVDIENDRRLSDLCA